MSDFGITFFFISGGHTLTVPVPLTVLTICATTVPFSDPPELLFLRFFVPIVASYSFFLSVNLRVNAQLPFSNDPPVIVNPLLLHFTP